MKFHSAQEIRNLALIGHSGSGKTTLAEAMLFNAGVINRQGKVEEGSTVSDYRLDEIERKISITTSLVQFEYGDKKMNVMDTPGYSDFVGEVKSALRVADFAIVPLHAHGGVEVGTELVWNFAASRKLGRFIVISLLDKEHSDFDAVLSEAKKTFGHGVLPIQFPVNAGSDFNSVVDVLSGKLLKFTTDGSGGSTSEDLSGELKSKADAYRRAIADSAAETDDDVLEKYLESGELSEEDLYSGLKKGVAAGTIFPVLCTSAALNYGVKELMEAILKFAPSPTDMPNPVGRKLGSDEEMERECSDDAAASLLVFKTISEAHVGELSLFRNYSGKVSPGDDLTNESNGKSERLGQLYSMRGRDREEIDRVGAGDIAAVVKLKATHTGDTLCDPKSPIIYDPIDFPAPVLSVAVSPKAKGDEEKISAGLTALHAEDPSFEVTIDSELSQMVLSAQGELHLQVVLDRLRNRFEIEVETNQPRIPYRETIKSTADYRAKYKKQTGGRGQYGDAHIKVEPLPRGGGFEFVNKVVGGVIPTKFIPSVEKGVRETLTTGVLANSKIVDVKATIFDGSHHSVDSSDVAFKIAGSMAFKKAFLDAKPVILEPIYTIEVRVPEEHMGDVMGDITARRGKILGMGTEGHFQVIKASVPLAELYKYSTALRSITGGRGIHKQEFSNYEEAPKDVEAKIVKAANEETEE